MHLHHHQSWHNSHMLHEWGSGYHHAMKSGCPSGPPLQQSPKAHRPQPPWVALHIKLGLYLFQFFCCQTFPLSALPQLGTHLLGSLLILSTRSGIAPPNSTPHDQHGKRAYAKTVEANVSSRHSTPQGNGELPKTTLKKPNNGMVVLGSTGEHDS